MQTTRCLISTRRRTHYSGALTAKSAAAAPYTKKGAADRTAAPLYRHRFADLQVCWIADSSQLAPRGRRKVHTSVASLGCSLPSTSRPLARSTVLSIIEKRIATLAKSVSPSRQASARSPCKSLVPDTLLTTLRALFFSRSPVKYDTISGVAMV